MKKVTEFLSKYKIVVVSLLVIAIIFFIERFKAKKSSLESLDGNGNEDGTLYDQDGNITEDETTGMTYDDWMNQQNDNQAALQQPIQKQDTGNDNSQDDSDKNMDDARNYEQQGNDSSQQGSQQNSGGDNSGGSSGGSSGGGSGDSGSSSPQQQYNPNQYQNPYQTPTTPQVFTPLPSNIAQLTPSEQYAAAHALQVQAMSALSSATTPEQQQAAHDALTAANSAVHNAQVQATATGVPISKIRTIGNLASHLAISQTNNSASAARGAANSSVLNPSGSTKKAQTLTGSLGAIKKSTKPAVHVAKVNKIAHSLAKKSTVRKRR